MSRKFLTPIDLNGLEIRNVRAQVLASDPVSPVSGQFWFNSVTPALKYYDGTSVISLALGTYAPLASPTFTGDPKAPTPAVDDNDTSIATTAYVIGQASAAGDGTPAMDGVAARGTAIHWARADHVHPVDTSRAALASPTFTGDPKAPTPSVDDNDTSIATTAYVIGQASAAGDGTPAMDGAAARGTAIHWARADHVHPTDTSLAPKASPALTGSPTAPTQTANDNSTKIATTAYVDNAVSASSAGYDPKGSVRIASTANLGLSGLAAIDGVTPVAGDRILAKDQTTASANGIYVAAAGAWSRSTDANSSALVTGGMYTWVNEGTANGDKGFALTTDDPITLGTTALTFTQVSGLGQITAGAGLTKTGDTLDVQVDASSIEINADTLRVKAAGITNAMLAGSIDLTAKVTGSLPIANGGTAGTTAATARANLAATGKFTQTIVGTATTEVITHNLNSRSVVVSVHDVSTFDEVECDVQKTSVNTITLGFAVAPAAGAYVVTVIG